MQAYPKYPQPFWYKRSSKTGMDRNGTVKMSADRGCDSVNICNEGSNNAIIDLISLQHSSEQQ